MLGVKVGCLWFPVSSPKKSTCLIFHWYPGGEKLISSGSSVPTATPPLADPDLSFSPSDTPSLWWSKALNSFRIGASMFTQTLLISFWSTCAFLHYFLPNRRDFSMSTLVRDSIRWKYSTATHLKSYKHSSPIFIATKIIQGGSLEVSLIILMTRS